MAGESPLAVTATVWVTVATPMPVTCLRRPPAQSMHKQLLLAVNVTLHEAPCAVMSVHPLRPVHDCAVRC
jgi:hypothetical protein